MNKEFIWTDELVAEYSLASQSLTLWDFKRKKMAKLEAKLEWEILSYKQKKSGIIMAARSVGVAFESMYDIYSIKRLSDGEVFTIGDKFIANAGCELTIKRFDVAETGMQVWSKEFGFWFWKK